MVNILASTMLEEMNEASTKDGFKEIAIKSKRKNLRGKIIRCIKQLNEGVEKGVKNIRRFQKEMDQLRKDFDACTRITQSVV